MHVCVSNMVLFQTYKGELSTFVSKRILLCKKRGYVHINEGLNIYISRKYPAAVLLGKSAAGLEVSCLKYLDRLHLQAQGFNF